MKSVRITNISDELWKKIKVIAAEKGLLVHQVVTKAFEEYTKK